MAKDGKTAAVLALGHGDENLAALELYRRRLWRLLMSCLEDRL